MPALGPEFDGAVPLQHVEDAVGAVEAGVFGGQLGVDLRVGGYVEGIDVWLGDAGPGKADQGAGPEGDDGVGGEGEAEVGFH